MTIEITAAEHDLLRFQVDTEELLRRGSPLWMDWLPAEVKPVALCAPLVGRHLLAGGGR